MNVRSKPESCVGCSCFSHGTDYSTIEGTGSSGVLLVGEASGEHEQRDQLPFRSYAPAGGVLERTIRRMGLNREQFSITNVLRCRPKNNWLENAPWEFSAISHCSPNLAAAIAERRPKVIVALGGVALRQLTGYAGEKQGISYLAGYPVPLYGGEHEKLTYKLEICSECAGKPAPDPGCFLCEGKGTYEGLTAYRPAADPRRIPVIGDFHPSFLRHGKMAYGGIFARILQRAMNIAKGTDREWLWEIDPESEALHAQLGYIVHPTTTEVEGYIAWLRSNSGAIVSYDLETSESASLDEDAREGFVDTQIRLAQFASPSRGAIAIPYTAAFRPLIQAILHTPNVKVGHNCWLFDNKVLAAAGERDGLDLRPRGVIHDTLQMLHHWQPDLPAHLQFGAQYVSFPFPWKHFHGSHLEFYGCADVDATLRLFTMLERTLQRDQLWGDYNTGYIGQVLEVRPTLADMEDRGMPIDDAARVKLGGEFDIAQQELLREIQLAVPPACRRQHPPDGYKGVPPEVKEIVLQRPGSTVEEFADWRFKEKDVEKPDGKIDRGEFYRYEQASFAVAVADPATGEPTLTQMTRWCRVYDFNPNSRLQVLEYMKAKKHPIPKDKHRENVDGENPETTNEKELRRLANKTGDLFYIHVVEYRGFTKLRGTYVDGFRPGPDGRVHTTFTFDTGIGQLSSRNPNVQNFPKLKPTVQLAQAMRAMVSPGGDEIITEWDFKSCHVITLGFLAEDLNYMRLGRLDIHSFVAGHFLRLWDGREAFKESDDTLRKMFKWLKSDPARKRVRDDQAKHGILGIGNGLKARGLFERYMESFPPAPCTCERGMVRGVRGMKKCPQCKGTSFVPGSRIAEQVLEVCEQLFPKVFAYQKEEVQRAHDQQWLKTPFGHIRRFYEVFRWDYRKNGWGHGDQHEEAVAYRLANIAFGHIREKLKMLRERELDRRYGLFNNVHDSFMFSFSKSLLADHVRDVAPVLLAPSRVLRHPTICPGGLVIDVEASWGPNWRDMTTIELPKQVPVDQSTVSVV